MREKLKSLFGTSHAWQIVFSSAVAAIIITDVLALLAGYWISREIRLDLLVLGTVIAAVVPAIIMPSVVQMLRKTVRLEEQNRTQSEMILNYEKQRQSDVALQKRADEMSLLYRMSISLASGRNLYDTLLALQTEIINFIQADAFYVAIYDAETDLVRYPIFFDEKNSMQESARLLHERPGLTGAVIFSGKTIYLPDMSEPEVEMKYQPVDDNDLPLRTFLGIPLISNEQVIGMLSVQFGAAVSKDQFGEIPPVGMVFLRLITSSLILLAIARPRVHRRPLTDWRPVLALGFALGAMNWAFYESFARIPLGVAVTIEFAGPLLLAAVGSRRPGDLVWVGLAALGITLFGAGPTKVNAVGFGLALVAGACWALYILSTAATGRRWAGVEGLAVASSIATLAIAPFAVMEAGERLLEPHLLALGALVGLLSSVIPYSLEMVALRTLPARVFGILMSLEPAVAALVAAVLLSEWLTPLQVLAIACVTAASVGAARTESVPEAPPRD